MSEERIDSAQLEGDTGGYEPPRVRPLGNVRELLAGGNGTQPDGDPDNPRPPE
jgi:hypothetical protein